MHNLVRSLFILFFLVPAIPPNAQVMISERTSGRKTFPLVAGNVHLNTSKYPDNQIKF